MTEKIEKQILEISSMIDGVNIAIERAREIRDKMLFEGIQETIGLDALLGVLRRDNAKLKSAMKELQQRFNDEYQENLLKRIRESEEPIPVRGILAGNDRFEDGINPDPDDWDSELEAIKEDDQSLRDHVNRRL